MVRIEAVKHACNIVYGFSSSATDNKINANLKPQLGQLVLFLSKAGCIISLYESSFPTMTYIHSIFLRGLE